MVDGPSGGRGKWSQSGVPHKGWNCENVEDLGAPDARCEMCESSDIRYVHYMSNPRYPETLACGAICAGHMEGDLAGAEVRDKTMKSNARRRSAFPNRKSWRLNSNGNWVLKADGFRITVFRKGMMWGGAINQLIPTRSAFTRERFATAHEAKLASFDTMMFLKGL